MCYSLTLVAPGEGTGTGEGLSTHWELLGQARSLSSMRWLPGSKVQRGLSGRCYVLSATGPEGMKGDGRNDVGLGAAGEELPGGRAG